MRVLASESGDGSADFTVSANDEDYSFSAYIDGDTAIVEYEETLTYRGTIRVSEPPDDIYKALLTSDEMTAFLEEHDLDSASFARESSQF